MATFSRSPACLEDFEGFAKEYLPKTVFDYYISGANEQQTLDENKKAFKRLKLRPRILRNVAHVDTDSSLLGMRVSAPIGISPTAMQKMAHPDGEITTAKAAASHGVCMTLSTFSTTSVEEISEVSPNSLKWYQLYIMKDRSKTERLVKKVERYGFTVLVVTVDTASFGRRLNDERNQFSPPSHLSFPNFEEFEFLAAKYKCRHKAYVEINNFIETNFTWSDVKWLRSITLMPIVLKGILTEEDAKLAVEHGVDGILVSNHGGRQLDGVPATIEVLPEIVQAVNGSIEVYLDGGIRHGTDVLKAIALGAKAVFIGRPILWGLAFQGEEGVKTVLQILVDEFRTAMALAGCQKIADINSSLLAHSSRYSML